MGYRLFNTAANFRALRELCGITQQQAADAMNVQIRTVKRWEKGETPVPDDALAWLRRCAVDHTKSVRDEISRMAEGVRPGEVLCLPYYRTQDQVDAEAEMWGIEALPFGFVNAIYRSVAERLTDMGYLVSFKYPDEERSEVKRV